MERKGIRRLLSAFLAAVTFVTSFAVEASAASKLTKSVEYDYYGAAFVTINPTENGTTIRYTTDDTVPTVNSTKYDGEIYVSKETVIRAVEFDLSGKKVASIKTTVKPKCAQVEFDIDYKIGKSVISLKCATSNAKIYYTIDGTKPNENSALYSEPITITQKTKIRAVAYLDGFKKSATVSKTVKIGNYIENDNEPDDEGETEKISYATSYVAEKGYMFVSLTPKKSSDTIYYTLDGSKPTKESKKYSKRIKLTENTTVRAKEYNKKGKLVATVSVKVKMKCAPVEFRCIDVATGTKTIELSTTTKGATIYYSIDGSFPDPDYSDVYTAPLTLGDKTTLSAVAVKDGWKDSLVKVEMAGTIPLELTEFNFGNPIYSETAVLLNSYRKANGQSQLELEERLTKAANIRAKELSVLMDHTRPSGLGYTSVADDCDVKLRRCTEFIEAGHSTAEEFLASVLSDKQNRNILLGDGYSHNAIGVGYYEKGKRKYWVLLVAEVIN